MLLLAACTGPKPDYTITDKDFRKGTDGLVFDFLNNGPPDTVFEDAEFDIAADIWNRGAYPVEEAYVTATLENAYMCILSGSSCADVRYDPAISQLEGLRKLRTEMLVQLDKTTDQHERLRINERLSELDNQISELQRGLVMVNPELTKSLEQPLNGRSVGTPQGNSWLVSFSAKSKTLDLLSVQHTSPVILTACYGYTTELAQDVCIDPDISSMSQQDKVCTVQDISLADQGAPVAIIRIETKMLPKGDYSAPQFLIYVQNKGDGEVLARNRLQYACSAAKLGREDWNRVYLSDFSFSTYKLGENIECTPNPLRLTGTDDYFRCTVTDSELERSFPAFVSQLFVKLDYGYMKSITKNVIVEKVR